MTSKGVWGFVGIYWLLFLNFFPSTHAGQQGGLVARWWLIRGREAVAGMQGGINHSLKERFIGEGGMSGRGNLGCEWEIRESNVGRLLVRRYDIGEKQLGRRNRAEGAQVSVSVDEIHGVYS